MQRLVIDGVDLEMLEEQRTTLGSALCGCNRADGRLELNPDAVCALSGIINMLDAWSDDRESSGRRESNRLPVTAADLLSALQSMVTVFNRDPRSGVDPIVAFATIESARAAIERAQG